MFWLPVGENSKYIADKAIELGMDRKNVVSCNSNSEAILEAKSRIVDNSYILVKASNGMKFKEIVDSL